MISGIALVWSPGLGRITIGEVSAVAHMLQTPELKDDQVDWRFSIHQSQLVMQEIKSHKTIPWIVATAHCQFTCPQDTPISIVTTSIHSSTPHIFQRWVSVTLTFSDPQSIWEMVCNSCSKLLTRQQVRVMDLTTGVWNSAQLVGRKRPK